MNNKSRQKSRVRAEVRRNRRAVFIGVFLCLCMVGLMARIYYWQEVWGDEYTRLVVQQEALRYISRVTDEFAPTRGSITDRNMTPIVGSQQLFTVFLDVTELHRRHYRNRDVTRNIREEVFEIILSTFDIRRAVLVERFDTNPQGELLRPTNHFILATEVPPEIAFWITDAVPEIHATQTSIRVHYRPNFAPQVIGFQRGDAIWGLEAAFDRQLAGDPGRTVWVQGEVEEIPVRDGYTIVTTLDPAIQMLAQRYVDQIIIDHPGRFVGAIVMNPNTGEIYAMAQAPVFQLDEPMGRETITDMYLVENWDNLPSDEFLIRINYLWRNYHVTMSGEPGSIFKPIVIAAAIEEGVISADSHFYCEGIRTIHDREIWCWDEWGHGAINLREALAISCNLAMVDINSLLGNTRFYRYRGYFGFGEYTGIDLPGEMDVSNPAVMYEFIRLGLVEMATSSIGQGFNATTIQSINAMAALINGGELMRPFVVSRIIDSHGNVVSETIPQRERRVVSQQTSDFLRREMQFVMTMDEGVGRRGTGRFAQVPGFAMGGKTGTAQQGPREDNRNTLTMILYTPVENPELIVLMTIDSIEEVGRHVSAGSILAPIMQSFMRELIGIRNIRPTDALDALDMLDGHDVRNVMSDFSGQRLADVVRNLNIVNPGGYHVTGRGTIIHSTIPLPGQPMPQNSPIFFTMDPATVIAGAMVSVPNVTNLTLEEATQFMLDVGLPVAFTRSYRRAPIDGDLFPRTWDAVPIDPDLPDDLAPTLNVYRQFPNPGTEIELGTEVLLRVR